MSWPTTSPTNSVTPTTSERMNDAERRAYLVDAGAFPLPRGSRQRDSDYAVGAGDFAEVFALCHSASPDFRSRLAPRPATPCELLPAGAR